jgi:(2Fe-2S) ferredoxin
MRMPERHVLVCTNTRPDDHAKGCCLARGSGSVKAKFKELIERRGLKERVFVNSANCLHNCEHGGIVVVYPEGVWYGGVQPEDVEEIVDAHLVNGKPVKRLRLSNKPRSLGGRLKKAAASIAGAAENS